MIKNPGAFLISGKEIFCNGSFQNKQNARLHRNVKLSLKGQQFIIKVKRDFVADFVIAGDTYPAAIVKSKLLKLTSEHIEYVK